MEREGELRLAVIDDVVGRARDGDAVAFTALVERHHAELVRVAYVVAGDLELARDAAQAAWVKAWQRLPSLRDDGHVRGWLVAIVANEARQAVRSRRRRAVREVPMPELEMAGSEDRPPGTTDVAAALARLDPRDRELIAMRYVAGFTSAEIAGLTRRSASGTRVRLSRLLQRLREELSDG